jgi:hypothetical protein
LRFTIFTALRVYRYGLSQSVFEVLVALNVIGDSKLRRFAPSPEKPSAQTLDNSNRTTTIGSRYAAFLAGFAGNFVRQV